jgi:hypothetical protein
MELEQTLQRRLDESIAKKEAQLVSFETKKVESDAMAVVIFMVAISLRMTWITNRLLVVPFYNLPPY